MHSIDSTTSLNKSFSSNSNAGTVCVYSGEIVELAVEESYIIGALRSVKQAIDHRIRSARTRDLNLGVIVSYGGVLV